MSYDFLVVGAGLYGATFARLATDAGKRCLVIDKRTEVAGNCYDERHEGILVNRYGGHIFHTNSDSIWNFVRRFSEFTQYEHRVKVNYAGEVYSFPINLLTFQHIFGTCTPKQAKDILDALSGEYYGECDSFQGYLVSKIGWGMYQKFFKGYTKKQWGREPRELPASIAKRIPIRLTYDDRYFSDKYQGMPVDGYTSMVERMLEGIEVHLGVEYPSWDYSLPGVRVVYSGPLDALFDYRFGKLEYRSLRFEHETLDGDYQGCATINYTDERIPYTRIIEWKHFRPDTHCERTVITREYPSSDGDPYYPIADTHNRELHRKYQSLVPDWMIVGGRLGAYQYLNMDQAIGMAMKDVRNELCK